MAESWKQAASALEEGEVFTKDAPGKWAGKEGGHTPVLTKNSDGSVTVKVNHVMVAADGEKDDHWIEYVYARDSAGTIVAIQKFVPTDENPTITFTPAEGAGTITPFELLQQAWDVERFIPMRNIISSCHDRQSHCPKYQWSPLRKPTLIRVMGIYFFCIRSL